MWFSCRLSIGVRPIKLCPTHPIVKNNKWCWIQSVKWSDLWIFGLKIWTSSLHLYDFKFWLSKQNVGKIRNICWNSSNHAPSTHIDVYCKSSETGSSTTSLEPFKQKVWQNKCKSVTNFNKRRAMNLEFFMTQYWRLSFVAHFSAVEMASLYQYWSSLA